MRLRSRKGIFLVTTLFVLLLVVAFAGAMFVMVQQMLYSTQVAQNESLARNAALSGLEYAKTRIHAIWGGYGPVIWQGSNETIENNNLHVIEHFDPSTGLGWIEGKIKGNPDSYFFIYFTQPTNLQFASEIPGNVTAKFRSVNNINTFTNTVENRDFSGNLFRKVPPLAANIVVQGRCGLSEKHAETMFHLLPSEKYQNLIASAGSLNLFLNNDSAEWLLRSANSLRPEVRVLNDLNVKTDRNKLVSEKSIDARNQCIGLVGSTAEFDQRYNLKPRDIGFSDRLGTTPSPGKPSVFRDGEGRPTINSTGSVMEKPKTELELDAGVYVFKCVGGRLKIYYFPSDDCNSGKQMNFDWGYGLDISYWTKLHGEDRRNYAEYEKTFNKLKQAIDVKQDGVGITGFSLKNNVTIKSVNRYDTYGTWFSKTYEQRKADSFRIISDSPYESTLNLGTKGSIRNNSGSVNIDSFISGSGGIYAENDIIISGRRNVHEKDKLDLFARKGNIEIDPKIIHTYSLTAAVSEYNEETGENETSYKLSNKATSSLFKNTFEKIKAEAARKAAEEEQAKREAATKKTKSAIEKEAAAAAEEAARKAAEEAAELGLSEEETAQKIEEAVKLVQDDAARRLMELEMEEGVKVALGEVEVWEDPNGEPAQYIAQAILEFWQSRYGGQTPCMMDLSPVYERWYPYRLREDPLATLAENTIIPFKHKGKVKNSATLKDILNELFQIDTQSTRNYVRQLLSENSRTYDGHYILDSTNMKIFQAIADGKLTGVGFKVATEETHAIRGLVYAGSDFKANLGTDSLTVQGSIIANDIELNCGNFNTIYDPRHLESLYRIEPNALKDLYVSIFNH